MQSVTEIGLHIHHFAKRHGHALDQWDTEEVLPYQSKRRFVADAVFTYDTMKASTLRVMELDRGTEGMRTLLNKILAYYAWTKYEPANNSQLHRLQWRRQFPGRRPLRLLFVFDCENPERRIEKLCSWTRDLDIWNRITVEAIPKTALIEKGLFEPVAFEIPTMEPTSVLQRN